ncbi:SAF domain-containing protein [Paenibacillus oenotherae]|uniref:SAF domain-containing protein n=1 Tax=Paenibacillus oenotherae TaxID=1435645 RepID=A0ABS7D971_9BACL|nr:SAF domain-containing protein [Paenibacillus oenotherae]MBW7476425.1 SAF domain-containing protein [Paenibacillus oenotherae]
MNRRRNLAISITAALISGLLVYGVYMLQVRQIQLQEEVSVIVPNRFVSAGERITADMLELKAIPRSAYDSGMLQDVTEVLGMEAVVPLGSGEPLLIWKVDKYRLHPSRTQSTFQIPRDYVLSVSNGIRAGDKVVLYMSGGEVESSRLFDEPVTVASVKTSANIEIDDTEHSNLMSLASGDREKMYASRRDANGMIDYINLNLSEEQWLRLDALCKDGGGKLVIAFSPQSLDVPTAAPEMEEKP